MSNKRLIQKDTKTYLDLLYMTPNEVTAKEIATLLLDSNGLTIELWDAMNVLELNLSNQNSIDFEPLAVDFKDPSDASFIKNRNIKTIFAVNLCEEDIKIAVSYFELIIERFSGFLCTDSADFAPVYVGSSSNKLL